MTEMAAGPESMDVEDWMPSKIYLSVPLMWEILQFNLADQPHESPTAGLLDASLAPPCTRQEPDESTTIEIIVATSPEISINTADGGQVAPTMSSYKGRAPPPNSSTPSSSSSASRDPAWNSVRSDKFVDQAENLSLNFTPWLYADSLQLANLGDVNYDQSQEMSDGRGTAWWEGDNFSNIMFSHF